MATDSETSEDAILGGRLRVRQPLRGHRVGHDAILLAAATCARPTEQAIELGAGVGAAAFAIAARAPGLKVTLVEVDPVLCALASRRQRSRSPQSGLQSKNPDDCSLEELRVYKSGLLKARRHDHEERAAPQIVRRTQWNDTSS